MKLAEAYGCIGLRCEAKEDVDAIIEQAMAINDQPVVIDFVVHAGRDGVADGRGRHQQRRHQAWRVAWRPTGTGARTDDQHTLSVLVENKPGVLVRIAGLFARRGFNIDSLAVGPTEHEEISRMTIVVNCEEHPLEQVTKQLNKLINVLKIVELEPSQAVQRELILVKVRADADSRSQGAGDGRPLPRARGRRGTRRGHRRGDRQP